MGVVLGEVHHPTPVPAVVEAAVAAAVVGEEEVPVVVVAVVAVYSTNPHPYQSARLIQILNSFRRVG